MYLRCHKRVDLLLSGKVARRDAEANKLSGVYDDTTEAQPGMRGPARTRTARVGGECWIQRRGEAGDFDAGDDPGRPGEKEVG